jgi:hypothetical protein
VKFLILANPQDTTAFRVSTVLQHRHGAGAVRLFSSQELVYARQWSHTLFNSKIHNQLTLTDNTVIQPGADFVIFNRLDYLDAPHTAELPLSERTYALMELHALVLSWLTSLPCPILNRPAAQGLSGQPRSETAWRLLAAQAGLPTSPLRLTSSSRRFRAHHLAFSALEDLGATLATDGTHPSLNVPARYTLPTAGIACTALVLGDRVLGDIQHHLRAPCLRLAQGAQLDLLQIHLAYTSTTSNDLTFFADALDELAAIADLLEFRLAVPA